MEINNNSSTANSKSNATNMTSVNVHARGLFSYHRCLSLDIECVQTITNDRAVASIAIVDFDENVLLYQIVKQTDVVDYRYGITGFKEGSLDSGISFESAVEIVKSIINKDDIIIGQSVQNDIEWLNLQINIDYHSYCDISEYFKIEYKQNGKPRIRKFSLRNKVAVLLNIEVPAHHSAVDDAVYAMKLFKEYIYPHDYINRNKKKLSAAKYKLSQTKWFDHNKNAALTNVVRSSNDVQYSDESSNIVSKISSDLNNK